MYLILALLVAILVPDRARSQDPWHSFDGMSIFSRGGFEEKYDPVEKTAAYWNGKAQSTVAQQIKRPLFTNVAKNVIMFLGDGMSIATLGATRAYLGQKFNKTGEEFQLSFEKFPFSGLSKTYCVDSQVADSACSATAYLCGVKANIATVGVTAAVARKDCIAMRDKNNHVHSIARWSQIVGKRTGLITSARVTHASPAGVYAHVADRDWESDASVKAAGQDPAECPDIASQLIYGETGNNLNVILGGGLAKFLPNSTGDGKGRYGERIDGKNLIDAWKLQKVAANKKAEFVSNRDELLNVDPETNELFGLFNYDHLEYNLDRNETVEPSLPELVEAAITVLSKGRHGYFLFVEGGRIDHGHHATLAQKALDETVQFSKAVERAMYLTRRDDTLIVVTSDHSHTMSYNGYPRRGNDILGISDLGIDGLPYSTLSYANGPGYKPPTSDGKRYNISRDDMSDKDYEFPSLAPLNSETHGGEDVGIFAVGPWAHLFSGVLEQNVIPHLMAYSSCVGTGITACRQGPLKGRHDSQL